MAGRPKPARRAAQRWTFDEDARLELLLERGLSNAQIADRLGRTEHSVDLRIDRTPGMRAASRPLTAREVARRLGIPCSKGVVTWIRAGWLQATRSQIGAGRGLRWLVTEAAMFAFMEDPQHWHRWTAERIPDLALREWATEIRSTERFLTLGEVARRYHVTTDAVRRWWQLGHVRTVRRGNNHLVPETALEGFVPPSMRSKAGMSRSRFSPAEDAQLLHLRDVEEQSWSAIARALGRNSGSIAGRYRRLQSRVATDERIAA